MFRTPVFKKTILVLGLIYGVTFHKTGNAMWAWEAGRALVQDAPEITTGVAAGAGAIYGYMMSKDRSDNHMPPMMTPPVSNDSNPLEDVRDEMIDNSLKSTITEVNKGN